jgi:hypothetical protein
MIDDRRFYSRGIIELDIAIGPRAKGKTVNISLGGILCRIDTFIQSDVCMDIIITKNGDTIEMRGYCNRIEKIKKRDYLASIEFSKDCISPFNKNRLKLAEYLRGY